MKLKYKTLNLKWEILKRLKHDAQLEEYVTMDLFLQERNQLTTLGNSMINTICSFVFKINIQITI